MQPSEEFGLIPKFGIEIEVPLWEGSEKQPGVRRDICNQLIKQEHMTKGGKYDQAFHRYHCDCFYCMQWLGGKVAWPVQAILQYDASLPDLGGEFITSPMLCTGLFLDNLEEIWHTVCDTAFWTSDIPNRRGTHTSPSVHVHVSVDNPYRARLDAVGGKTAIWGFMPELFKIAAACGTSRGLEYCSINPDNGHHSALNIVKANAVPGGIEAMDLVDPIPFGDLAQPMTRERATQIVREAAGIRERGEPPRPKGGVLRYEWRMWEAAYKDWAYTKGVIVISCALTQLLANKETATLLSMAGTMLEDPFDWAISSRSNDTKALLKQFSTKRFDFLADSILATPLVTEDRDVYVAASALLDRVRKGAK